MTKHQTTRCIFEVAASKMSDRYNFELCYFSINGIKLTHYRREWLRDEFILTGILRDIAGAMGWYILSTPFYNGKEYTWYAYYCKMDESNIINCVYLVSSEDKSEGVPMVYESAEHAELAAVWQIMHTVYGTDYCAGIEREVCG